MVGFAVIQNSYLRFVHSVRGTGRSSRAWHASHLPSPPTPTTPHTLTLAATRRTIMSNDKLPFGRRLRFESAELKVQIDSLDNDLKTDLYNSFLIFIYNKAEEAERSSKGNFVTQHKIIWVHFLRNQLDKFPDYDYQFLQHINQLIYKQVWHKTYELFEFIFNSLDSRLYKMDGLIQYVNDMLERNNSAYRIVDNHFVPITNKAEIEEVGKARENAVSTNILGLVHRRINKCTKLLFETSSISALLVIGTK